jgi:hypothetical protein
MRADEAMRLLTLSGFLPYVTLMPKDNPRLHVPAVHKEHGNEGQQQMVSVPVMRPPGTDLAEAYISGDFITTIIDEYRPAPLPPGPLAQWEH